MDFVPYDRRVAVEALSHAADGHTLSIPEYNGIVVLLGLDRDGILDARMGDWDSRPPRVSVPGTPGESKQGPLVGWTYGKTSKIGRETDALFAERAVAGSALGYALRALRTGRRFVRSSDPLAVALGGPSWSQTAAVVGEVATSIISPYSLPPGTRVSIDPSAARAALDAHDFFSILTSDGAVPEQEDRRSRVLWMAREYALTSGRAELFAYFLLTLGTLSVLGMFGAFRLQQAPQDQSVSGFGGLPASPYGAPIARPTW